MSKKKLTDGLDQDQCTELGDLSEIEQYLLVQHNFKPDSALLLKRLKSILIEQKQRNNRETGIRYWLRLARSQISLMTGIFWLASGLLLIFGIILSALSDGAAAMLFAILSPVLAIGGVGYIFRPSAHSLREMELFSVVKPLELLYARLVLLLSYNSGLTLIVLLVAWSQGVQIVLGRMLLIWLGPMIGLTGLALYATIRWDIVIGICAPLGLWCVLIFLGWREAVTQTTAMFTWITAAQVVQQSDMLQVIALSALLGGIGLVWLSGNLLRQEWKR